MKSLIKNNLTIIIYVIIAVILELTTNAMVCGNLIIAKPWFALSLLLLCVGIMLLLKKGIVRYWIACALILVQGVINIFCVIPFLTE